MVNQMNSNLPDIILSGHSATLIENDGNIVTSNFYLFRF